MRTRIAVMFSLLLIVAACPASRPATAGGINAVTTAVARGPVTESRYRWPLAGDPVLTRQFQPPPQPWLPGHRGVDLGGTPGVAVRAAGAGVVSYAGRVAGVGVVSVDHADGLRTTYEPVAPTVRTGQVVRAGEPIGLLLAGHPGCPVAACLHWGLRRGPDYLDPLTLLGYGRVRLLPLARTAAGRMIPLSVPSEPAGPPSTPGLCALGGVYVGSPARGCACRYAPRSRSIDTWV